MKLELKHGGPAFCIAKWTSTSPFWRYINIYGPCFGCAGGKWGAGEHMIGRVYKEGASEAEAMALAKSVEIIDTRTLESVKAACCPPELINELLGGGPG